MGKIELDKLIIGQENAWGGNYNSMEGCSHDSSDDKIDSKIEGKEITLNVMSTMDAPRPKTSAENPGFDKGFWAKAKPLQDTTGHGTLTRKLKD